MSIRNIINAHFYSLLHPLTTRFDKDMNTGSLPGKGPFVAAFPNANQGDVSPNTKGPHCLDTGLSCDNPHSTCNGKNELCVGSGPGRDMFESTYIIGMRQYMSGRQLFDAAKIKLSGPVSFAQQFVDMTSQRVNTAKGVMTTCKAAMGHAFAAGTTDGPGEFDFKQATTTRNANPFWDIARNVIKAPSPELIRCQYPKPILLATGEMQLPYPWQPAIVDLQVMRIGQTLVLALPGEFSTMAGRRMRETIRAVTGNKFEVMMSGLANTYTSYMVTPEEYNIQRYEGASTIYGPYTVPAYIDIYVRLANAAANNQRIAPTGLQPPYLLHQQIQLIAPVLFDNPVIGKRFGDVLFDVLPVYQRGKQQVFVQFVAANPRNDRRQESTFLTIEMKAGNNWIVIATDGNWETRFYWNKQDPITGMSRAIVTWEIPSYAQPGIYRIQYFGASKSMGSAGIKQFVGTSKEFQVTA